ncbi:hypothetical protein BC629DRAFT_1642411 [Irpex lacteus]|nr:hypothetical protein BC629DRAFT_1642411 [Irpex lacteus]
MSISVVSFLCAAVAGWAAWLLSRHYILPSPLDRNMAALFGTDAWEMYGKLRAYGSVSKLHGILGTKNLFTYDPKLLQHMLLKNQQIFKDPDWFNVYCMACFGPGLLSVHGR